MADMLLLLQALLGGLLRISPALLLVAAGDCLSQRSGSFNFGLEGIVAVGAVAAVTATAAAYSPWLGLLGAAAAGGALALGFALCCLLPAVNGITVGVAFFLGALALARFAGSELLAVAAPVLPAVEIGLFADQSGRATLQVSVFLLGGIGLALAVDWLLRATRLGLLITAAGSRGATAGLRAAGVSCAQVRVLATAAGGACGGLGGACLAMYYPGGWSDNLASGVGLTALTLVFLGRGRPLVVMLLVMMFAAVAALGPALQALYGTGSYHLLNVLPFVAALLVMLGKGRPQ